MGLQRGDQHMKLQKLELLAYQEPSAYEAF